MLIPQSYKIYPQPCFSPFLNENFIIQPNKKGGGQTIFDPLIDFQHAFCITQRFQTQL